MPLPDRPHKISPADDPQKLFYPVELAEHVGLSNREVSALRRRGCAFFGRKTCLAWVREFIARESGARSAPARKPTRSLSAASK